MSGDRSAERFARAGRHACAGKHDSTSRHETATPGVSELCARPRYILYSYLLALVVSTGCTVGVGLIALVVLLHLSCHDPLDLPGPMPWAFVLFETRPDLVIARPCTFPDGDILYHLVPSG